MDVGSLRQRHLDAIAVPLESISKKLGVSIAAVLGYSFLHGRVVQFDYSHRQFGFAQSSAVLLRGVPAQCLSTVAFRYDDDVLVDDVRVNGLHAIANIDTGSNGFAAITPEATARLRLGHLPKAAAVNEGFNGAYASARGRLARVAIGQRTFNNVPATFWARGTGHDGKPFDVNVGNRLLSELDPVFDFVKHRFTITACADRTRKK